MAAATGGCLLPSVTVQQAEKLMKDGKLDEACAGLERGMDRSSDSRSERLIRVRTAVRCRSEQGRLDRAADVVDGLSAGPLRQYGRALVTVAKTPAGLKRALDLLSRARQSWPSEPELWYRAGVWLLADQRFAEAVALLKKAHQLQPSAAAAVALAHGLLDLDRMGPAMTLLRTVPSLNPTDRDIARGRALVRRVIRRTRTVPPSIEARYREALRVLHKEDKAGVCVNVLEELLADHPDLAALHTALGLAHVRLGNGPDAVVALRRAARENPHDPTNQFYLAVLYQGRGRRDRALTHYKRTLELDPFHAAAAARLGDLWLQTGRHKEAAALLDRLVRLDGGKPATLRLAARAHLAARSWSGAERYLTRLVDEDPKDFEVNLRLAQLLIRTSDDRTPPPDRVSRARKHAEAAAKVRPDDPEVQKLLSRLDALP